jgi:hypothetical protein
MAEERKAKGKQFFFEKKNQKTFDNIEPSGDEEAESNGA